MTMQASILSMLGPFTGVELLHNCADSLLFMDFLIFKVFFSAIFTAILRVPYDPWK